MFFCGLDDPAADTLQTGTVAEKLQALEKLAGQGEKARPAMRAVNALMYYRVQEVKVAAGKAQQNRVVFARGASTQIGGVVRHV